MLRIPAEQVVRAREELVARDLVAHESPLTQVLSLLPGPQAASRGDSDVESLAEILRRLGERES